MESDFVFLTEKQEMWAKMLMEVLQDNNILCVSSPVYGAALRHKTGAAERLRIFVPQDKKQQAEELCTALFSPDSIEFDSDSDFITNTSDDDSEYKSSGFTYFVYKLKKLINECLYGK